MSAAHQIPLDDDDTLPGDDERTMAVRDSINALRIGVTDWGATTAKGRKRPHNEDAHGRQGDRTWIVCDGMGGRHGGEVASALTIEALREHLDELDAAGARPHWPDVIAAVNRSVQEEATRQGFDKVGSTLVLARVDGAQVTIVHAGDSRAYSFELTESEDAVLTLLTQDHNVLKDMLAAGVDTRSHGGRDTALTGLTSFIGMTGDPKVGVVTLTARPGMRIMLCTDGIHGQVGDDRLRSCLRRAPAQSAADSLTAAADGRGGRDNATALIIEFGRMEP